MNLLKTLDSNAKPLWGIISPIHMVENLAYGFDMSVHNFIAKKIDKEVEQNKAFVKEKGFPISKRKRIASDLKPTVNENLNDAIIELDALIREFYDVLGEMDDAFKTSHFYFGQLNFDE
ncbi:hypothetical protein [uncultured Aquimarina sp.]|uniref:hypothetical protein n=1 Tax=uncultured Aquimarina sp. TaxID=575652 RepID=UPI00262BCEB6|nr:hypothetical protein [uncultured Aquimarina sp.]